MLDYAKAAKHQRPLRRAHSGHLLSSDSEEYTPNYAQPKPTTTEIEGDNEGLILTPRRSSKGRLPGSQNRTVYRDVHMHHTAPDDVHISASISISQTLAQGTVTSK